MICGKPFVTTATSRRAVLPWWHMAKRAGTTEKISISVKSAHLSALRKRAKRLYDGNLSAVIAELAADAAFLEGMHKLVEDLGGPILTDEDRIELQRELAGPPLPAAKTGRTKSRKKAA
jgi:hypothetical protein